MNIEEIIVNKLIEKNFHFSIAESCTGGLCSAKIVSVSNASKVFVMSFTTYSNESKIELLGVSESPINQFGVVSQEVAREMAVGVSIKAGSQVGVGVTGIAGPTGETKNKPIGMVCFGFYVDGEVKTYTKYFGNVGRNVVRENSVNFVCKTLNDLL